MFYNLLRYSKDKVTSNIKLIITTGTSLEAVPVSNGMKIRSLLVSVLVVAGMLAPAAALADTVSLNVTSPTVGVGGTISITISGGTDFYVASNTNPSIMSYTLSGPIMTINGINAGSATLSICNISGNCSPLTVTVGAATTSTSSSGSTTTSGTTVALLTTHEQTLSVGQTVSLMMSGASSYFISVNQNSDIASASLNNYMLALTGLAPGSAKIIVCGTSGGCATINATVTAASTPTPAPAPASTPTTPATTPTPAVAGVTTSASTNASLLVTIQTMQTQLTQMLQAIQAMQTQLNQIAASLKSSSVAGVTTPTTGSYYFTGFLALESTGAEVTALQQKLTKEGFYSGPITGTFGPLTEAAVKKYQSAKGIDPVGYVGPSTRAALNTQ